MIKFTEMKLPGAYVIEPQIFKDSRGFFGRSWCREEFGKLGLNTNLCQVNLAYNIEKSTLRGMHYQEAPHAETKLVRCTWGEIYDVIVDLRPGSPTLAQHIGVTLSADNHLMLYVPEGFAHGYQTLTDGAEITYLTTAFYAPDAARGVRYDDPAFGIKWPLPVSQISESDRKWTPYRI